MIHKNQIWDTREAKTFKNLSAQNSCGKPTEFMLKVF